MIPYKSTGVILYTGDNYFIDTAFSKGYEDLLRLQGNIPYYLPGREQVGRVVSGGFSSGDQLFDGTL